MAINTTTDLNVVGTSQLVDESVTTDKLDGQAVTAAKIHTGAVTEAKIADDAVTAAKIATGAVGATELASASVGTAKIDSGAATSGQFLKATGSGGASFASVEGSAVASTGATNGQVLTANGSGGATFAASASSGALSISTATAAFSTAAAGTAAFAYQTGAANAAGIGVSIGGSTFMTITNNNNYSASTRVLRTWDIGNTTQVASVTLSPVAAGTTIVDQIGGAGFAAGTSFVVKENLGSGGTWTNYLRKFTRGGTNSWNTTLATFSLTGNQSEYFGPFGGYPDTSPHWSQTLGAWYGGDYRAIAMATATTGGAGTVSIWLVNDVSGSAYSAPFGTASSTISAFTYCTVFVPDNSGTPTAGTIHAWGRVQNSGNTASVYRYCKYTAGSASITAASTADNTLFGASDSPDWAIWDSTNEQILLANRFGIRALDRTGGTVLWRTPANAQGRIADMQYGSRHLLLMGAGGQDAPVEQHYDLQTGWSIGGYGRLGVRKFGSPSPAMVPYGMLAIQDSTSNYAPSPLVGVGSATHFLTNNQASNGTVYQYPLAGIARVQIAGTSSASYRQLNVDLLSPSFGIISFDAPNSYEIANGPSVFDAYDRNMYLGINTTLIAPGTAIIYANVANTFGTESSTLTNLGTAGFLTLGGTATVQVRTVTMA
jgi:hypothetical protein